MKRILSLGLIALLLLGLLTACGKEGPKTVTFTVNAGEAVQEFTITTEKATMEEALAEAEIVRGMDYTTYAGITANPVEGTSWWITCNGEDMMRAWKNQPVKDGDAYMVTLLTD